MCQSQAEGGRRCVTHTLTALDSELGAQWADFRAAQKSSIATGDIDPRLAATAHTLMKQADAYLPPRLRALTQKLTTLETETACIRALSKTQPGLTSGLQNKPANVRLAELAAEHAMARRQLDAALKEPAGLTIAPGSSRTITGPNSPLITVTNRRNHAHTDLRLDPDTLLNVAHRVGISGSPKIDITLKHKQSFGDQGSCTKINPNHYAITVYVMDKDTMSPAALYAINNSLIHELRHVTQHQHDRQMNQRYTHADRTVGNDSNPFEIDARAHGRLADRTGKKDTGSAGRRGGRRMWAINA